MYAPICYDKNDTNCYLDPAGDSVLAEADNGGANYPLQTSSSQRYMIQAMETVLMLITAGGGIWILILT